MIRRALPYTLLPLSLIACVLASVPWLRAFPSDVMAVPLFGAAVLSVLVPLIVVGIGVRRLLLSAVVDVVLFVFYELLVTLREPAGFGDLYTGLVHGPAQILSFALPLVSPRTLLVAPVALCWLCGALIGECLARGWQSALPYLTMMVTFGLAYAGTARAVTSSTDGRRYDTLFAGALLLALLLLRAAQAWVVQDESAETTQPDGVMPLRGVAIGSVLAVAVAAAAAGAVQSSAFAGQPYEPARQPPIDQNRPLTPIAFVSGLRPNNPANKGSELFQVRTDRASSNYFVLASVDYYDGDSWSFNRTFRPSGGVVPADPDPAMRPRGGQVTQQYMIDKGPMTAVPWMPYVDRAQRITGVSVNIDPTSGMIVPTSTLRPQDEYTVVSAVPGKSFDQLGDKALVGTSAAQVDTTLPNGLADPLDALIASLARETGAPRDQPIAFLQAVAQEFRAKDSLAGPLPSGTPTPASSATDTGGHFVAPLPGARPTPNKHHHSPHPSHTATPTPTPTPTATQTPPVRPHTGGTTFADVLASIRVSRSGTPEQFATLLALIARELDVPARLVSGFRIPLPGSATTLPAGTHSVMEADAWTWVEIPIRGMGWVVVDPSPGTYSGATPPRSTAAPSSHSPSPTPSQNAQLTHVNNGGNAVAPQSPTPHVKGKSTVGLVVIVLLAVLALAVALLCFLFIRKRVRARGRRRRADPRGQLLGAWQEGIDVLVEAGLPDLTYATSTEVATATATRFGAEPATQARLLGGAANVAIFNPATPIAPDDAQAAWRAQTLLGRSVRRTLPWRDRVVTQLRYNRPKRSTAPPAPLSWAEETQARAVAAKSRRGKHR
ncbi:MAG TPA: transglutaminase-like domain-containing protein [Jatrophihabitans sp.]|jgi:transglutaminase-like putative cysteine protease|nr:transglutaminase-like domain-containing protein [Jatrophihabitans sp.]